MIDYCGSGTASEFLNLISSCYVKKSNYCTLKKLRYKTLTFSDATANIVPVGLSAKHATPESFAVITVVFTFL